jgi:hypothetical protein
MSIIAKFKLPAPTSKADWGNAFRDIERMVAAGEIKPDATFMLYFTNGKEKRTTSQNSYYWGVILKVFSESIGYEPEQVHEIFKSKFAGYTFREFPGVKRKKIQKTTSGMTKEEMSVYIEKCIAFAAEWGIVIPSPTALKDEEFVELVATGVLKG